MQFRGTFFNRKNQLLAQIPVAKSDLQWYFTLITNNNMQSISHLHIFVFVYYQSVILFQQSIHDILK